MRPIDDFFEPDDITNTRAAVRGEARRHRKRRNTITVILVCALVAGIIGGLVFALTRSGGGPTVPELVGLSYEEAEKELEKAGLSIEADTDQDTESMEAGELGKKTVDDQDPKEGTEVEEDTFVTVHLKGVSSHEEEPVAADGEDEDEPVIPEQVKTVCLDPGHSTGCPASEIDPTTGLDVADNGGAAGELQAMWDLAVKMKAQLEQMGYTVQLTKPTIDTYSSLRTRADHGNTCDIMVRLHYDFNLHAIIYPGVGQFKAKGDSRVYVNDQVSQWSQELAQAMLPHLESVGVTKAVNDCGGTSNNTGAAFVGSVLSRVPVVLIEYVPSTVRDNPAGQDQVAVATAQGIDAYFKSR